VVSALVVLQLLQVWRYAARMLPDHSRQLHAQPVAVYHEAIEHQHTTITPTLPLPLKLVHAQASLHSTANKNFALRMARKQQVFIPF
jgi:hypothetical protein